MKNIKGWRWEFLVLSNLKHIIGYTKIIYSRQQWYSVETILIFVDIWLISIIAEYTLWIYCRSYKFCGTLSLWIFSYKQLIQCVILDKFECFLSLYNTKRALCVEIRLQIGGMFFQKPNLYLLMRNTVLQNWNKI